MSPFQRWLIFLAPVILPSLVPLLFLSFEGSSFEWIAFIGWVAMIIATLVCAVSAFTMVGNWVRARLREKPNWIVVAASCCAVGATFLFYLTVGTIGCTGTGNAVAF